MGIHGGTIRFYRALAPLMLKDIVMVLTPDLTGFNQLLPDKIAAVDWCTVFSLPDFIVPENTSPSVAPTPLDVDVQPQPPYALFPETQMETLIQVPYDVSQGMAQDLYLPLQYTPDSSTVWPLIKIAASDNGTYTGQWKEVSDGMDISVVDLAQSSMMLPATPQSPPTLSSAPISPPNWMQVPQRIYDHGRRQWDFKRSESIPFSVNGSLGINMRDAFRKHFTGLDGRDDPMFQNTVGTFSCRFLFPGYPSNPSAQISTLDWGKDRVPITRSKLAYEVAKKLNQYLESMTGHLMEQSVDRRWKIGEGFMRLENMFLVRLVSVSKGSFQPEIWVVDTLM
ncbi:hypothetical protein BDM02DRAFT_3272935 [Thelephora ganbajun]|uniref:Uncharacterized protein n=1 Tax=Thelephora ganbajun TaxID=370292 RepID=A0ACB6Z280_THEGA|nr:hypothetical protein BDM02DRAFT_3272935 [Thelephora ganbajun]